MRPNAAKLCQWIANGKTPVKHERFPSYALLPPTPPTVLNLLTLLPLLFFLNLIQRRPHLQLGLLHHMRVDLRRLHALMPEQFMHRPDSIGKDVNADTFRRDLSIAFPSPPPL